VEEDKKPILLLTSGDAPSHLKLENTVMLNLKFPLEPFADSDKSVLSLEFADETLEHWE